MYCIYSITKRATSSFMLTGCQISENINNNNNNNLSSSFFEIFSCWLYKESCYKSWSPNKENKKTNKKNIYYN